MGKPMQKYDFMRVKSAQNKNYSTKWIANRYGYGKSTINNMKRCKTFAEYKKRFCGDHSKPISKPKQLPKFKQTGKCSSLEVVVIKRDSHVETFAAVMAALAGAAIIFILALMFVGAI